MKKTMNIFMCLVGAMDVCTGMLLVVAPALTLRLMGLTQMPLEPVFTQWIGVFVFSLGSAYLLPFLEKRLDIRIIQQRFSLRLTLLTRGFVGLFAIYAIVFAGLEPAWGLVAITDLSCALYQFFLLREV